MESEDQPTNSDGANAQTTSKNKKNKNKKKNKLGKIKAEQETPDQSQQQDFDYSNVDFKKFAGGSIKEQKNDIKMKFQGKVRHFLHFNNFHLFFLRRNNILKS